ncbi:amino acid ABC transporter permease [Neoasaia chiangmaiensis NBRC 101099]|uniref:Uncharacterized protein n=1 Tax=Neoasaia chiangmaiensis TaxID=320497 RepID=A0A1U9KS24_9PROT|nr:ABC transporter substrate-binding protein [Neoasaia chiangmaiensis]AQS88450.1 hypothetical protein A0U93_11470 [Neoasaia chiangmaiensis]GBR36680.1 amino acid ABC transporter permease [Neoasaia chiangmaiensis NBRC 101099]GEN15264.1 ABC transporter substrate-binding protein [Neoasaia chiangmaiensis]
MTGAIRSLLFGMALFAGAGWPAAMAAQALRIAVNPIYPPLEFRDPVTDTLTGFDIDFGRALAARMGMTAKWEETSFPQMIPSVQSGRTDLIISGFSDLPKRRALLDFVPYLQSGAQVLVLKADPVVRAEDLCGRPIAASRATSFPAIIRAWSQMHCARAGRPDMIFYPSESGADARIQLLQGRVAAMVQGRETVGYFIDITHHAFRRLGPPLSDMTLAIALPKGAAGLQASLRMAFASLRADGTYARLLRRWALDQDAITPSDGHQP